MVVAGYDEHNFGRERKIHGLFQGRFQKNVVYLRGDKKNLNPAATYM
jgi:hypothetical protein